MGRISEGRIFKRRGVWQIQYYLNGKEIRKSLQTGNQREAERKREEIMRPFMASQKEERLKQVKHALSDIQTQKEELLEEYRDKLTLEDTWNKYLASPERPQSGEGTLAQYQFQWNAFAAWMAEQNISLFKDVSRIHANNYISFLSNTRKLATGTINKHINLLKLVYTVLGDEEKLTVNPFSKIKRKADKQNKRKELTLDKIAKICDMAEGEMKLLFFLGLYTGMRLKDCCLLTWDEVDMLRKIIIHIPFKTARQGTKVNIPIHPCLTSLLEETSPDKRNGYVLPDTASHYINSRNVSITDKIQKLFHDAGLELYKHGTGPGTSKRAVLQYGFHSLRHSAVTLLAEAGVAPAAIQSIIGHNTVRMSDRYTHVGMTALTSAVMTLPALNNTATTITSVEELRNLLVNAIKTANQEQLTSCLAILKSNS